ncbi:MAG: tripartite tricarboxylate transporter TctB family protein [Deltaproteobacteria bacterium]|nr:tripartite tricarboxylate transporter TctB family protein [Deltaproteobacteria bacterium]
METDRKTWYTCHILFSVALILAAIYIIIDSLKMSIPLMERGQATILDIPGLTPIICSLLLIILSLVVIVSAWRSGGTLKHLVSPDVRKALGGREAIVVYKVFTLLLLYVYLLLPFLPYWASTFLFMVVFMLSFRVFSWKTILISFLVAILIKVIFGDLFGILLPK